MFKILMFSNNTDLKSPVRGIAYKWRLIKCCVTVEIILAKCNVCFGILLLTFYPSSYKVYFPYNVKKTQGWFFLFRLLLRQRKVVIRHPTSCYTDLSQVRNWLISCDFDHILVVILMKIGFRQTWTLTCLSYS